MIALMSSFIFNHRHQFSMYALFDNKREEDILVPKMSLE